VYDQTQGSGAQNGWFSEFQLPLKTILLFLAGFKKNFTLCMTKLTVLALCFHYFMDASIVKTRPF
jgi:hypothetical protein